MTDREKEAIEILKDDEMYITDSFYREFRTTIADKYTKAFETVLNLLNKQQEQVEEWKRDYNHRCQLAIDRKIELEKKDKMIDEMARMLVEVPNSVSDDPMTAVAKAMMNRDLEIHKRAVIDYVRNKVESEEK